MLDHVLSVGGTGMLAGATSEIAARARTITVVARRPERWAPPANVSATVVPIAVDWRDEDAAERAVRRSIEAHGPLGAAIIWTHATGSAALTRLVGLIGETSPSARIIQVVGSAAGRPGVDREARRAALLDAADASGLDLRVAVLGFAGEDGNSRWLTHAEISSGVIEVLDGHAAIGVVGRIEPWEQRPVS
jgi:hypothetical protein